MAKREAHRSERLHARAVVPAELDPPEARVGSGDRRMSGKRSGNHRRRETTADVDAKAKAKEASRATVAVAAERKKLSASRRAFERTAPSKRSLDAKPRATSRDAARNPPRAPEESTVPPKRVERRPSSSRTDRRGAKPRSAPDAHHREGDRDHHRRVAPRERTRTRTRVVAERVHEGGSPAGRLRAATRKAPKEEDIHARGRKPFVLAELGASLASAEATAELSRRGEASGRDLGAALVADIAASATAAAIASRREALSSRGTSRRRRDAPFGFDRGGRGRRARGKGRRRARGGRRSRGRRGSGRWIGRARRGRSVWTTPTRFWCERRPTPRRWFEICDDRRSIRTIASIDPSPAAPSPSPLSRPPPSLVTRPCRRTSPAGTSSGVPPTARTRRRRVRARTRSIRRG